MKQTTIGAPRSFKLLSYLRNAIGEGQFAEGTQLPPERDLAAMFGVGRTTVRRVLAELDKEGLVERRHGSGTYVEARSARASGALSTLCVLVPDAGPALSFGLFRGVEEAAARGGYRVVLSHHDATQEKEQLLETMAAGGTVGGYVIFGFNGAFIERFCRSLTGSATPFVTVDSRVPGSESDLVATDNHHAAFEGTSALIASGHSSIAYLGRYRKGATGPERLRGYLDALQKHDIERNDDLIAAYTEGPGDSAGEDALRFVREEGATAIFIGTEPMLPAVQKALAASDLPAKSLPAIASLQDPFGSGGAGAAVAIRQPLHWLGIEAGRLILDRIDEKRNGRTPAPARTVLVRPEVVVNSTRHTSATPRRRTATKT